MEDPQVIREIDALIDSYNWEGLAEEPEKFATSIKLSFRTPQAWIHMRLASPQGMIALHELLVQLLQHPRVTHKGRILESLPNIPDTSSVVRRNFVLPFLMQRRQFLQRLTPLLLPYLKHHNPDVRIRAVIIFSMRATQLDQTVNWLLDTFEHEHSFMNMSEILHRIGMFFEYSRGSRLRPETYQRLMRQLERLLDSKRIEMKIDAASLILKIRQHSTPAHVLDVIIESWPHLDVYRPNHRWILTNFQVWVYKVGKAKVLDFATTLLRQSRQFIVALIIWEEISENYFDHCMGQRRLVLSHEQKFFLEAALACKVLWRTREIPVPEHHLRTAYIFHPQEWGLEATRSTLVQQLKHAQIVEKTEDVFYLPHQGAGLPLHLDENLLWRIEK